MAGDPACWSHLFDDYSNEGESEQMTKAKTAGRGKREAGSGKSNSRKSGAKPRANGQAPIPADLRRFLSDNDGRIMQELFDFLRIPSASARSEHNSDTKRAAEREKTSLDKIGVPAKIYPTAGHPVVVGERRNAPGAPTVLIYGHYDVQPAEPLDLWTSPAFEPTVRNGNLFGRGTADDKGQVHIHLKALESLQKVNGKFPVNIKVLIKGEEEVGRVSMWDFV